MRQRRYIPVKRIPNGIDPRRMDDVGRQSLLSTLDAMPIPLERNQVPVDLRERPVQEYADAIGSGGPPGLSGGDLTNYWLKRITAAAEMIASTLILTRGLVGRVVPITTTQTQVADAQYLRGYIFLNPAASVGLTSFQTVLASTAVTVAGNTQSTSIGVANFRNAHFFIDVTDTDGGATTLVIVLQVFDPLTETWFDAQVLLTAATTGSFYVNAGSLGIATDMAIRWTVTGGTPTATFSVGVVLKDGLAGSSSTGLTQTIYLGPSGVSTVSGFPLLEGQSKAFFLKENIRLFGIGDITGLSLRVFEL